MENTQPDWMASRWTMDIIQPHWMAEYTSCDQLAQTDYKGVGRELSRRLILRSVTDKETVPPEDCKSWQEYIERNRMRVTDHWQVFTEDERSEINEVFRINQDLF
tara:strand:+ start:1589 stop:1903 length:315 start_codon:yes stop_codon:yes gene_type:complete